jgi:mannosylglycerate hydrolase
MYTLHLISHTHWDREWYLTFQQFRLKLVHLVDELLELLENDPDYRYYMLDGQTIVLDDYLHMRPEKRQILEGYIRSGRLLIGPWHILPDTFLVGPEAHIRNLLQGDRTARQFGAKMMVGYIPDPFGHIGQMPQILRGFGIQEAAFARGLGDEPCEVWWQAPDGSRVLAGYLRDSYGNAAGLPTSDPERFAAEVRRLRDTLIPHSSSHHLLLMQGTDHMEAQPDTSAAIRAAQGKLDGDQLVQSTLPAYFSALRAAANPEGFPVVEGELRSPKRHHLLPGVLSTRMWIKQRNQACETLLERWAEPFSTWAEFVLGEIQADITQEPGGALPPGYIRNPAPLLRQTWRLLMENHPHDSICGCSIDQVHEEMHPRFDQVEQIGEQITRQSLLALAGAVDTRSGPAECPSVLVIFNPIPGPQTGTVTVELTLPNGVSDFLLRDEHGNTIPHQRLGAESQELINVSLNRQEMADLIGNLHDGQAANLSIQELHIERQEETVLVDAIMAEGAAPNLKAWQDGLAAFRALTQDPAVTTFQVRARSPEAVQVTLAARQAPGLGWTTVYVHPLSPAPPAPLHLNPLARRLLPLALRFSQTSLGRRLLDRPGGGGRDKPPYVIQNEFLRAEAAADGTLTLTDLRSGTVLPGLNRFVDGGDCGDEYNYCPPPDDSQQTARLKRVRVRSGSVLKTLEIELELPTPAALTPDRQGRSPQIVTNHILTRLSLAPGVPRLDIQTEIDNRAADHRLRVHFSSPYSISAANHDGHFEVVRRPVVLPAYDETWVEDPRPEVPQRAFSDVSDGRGGLMIANRGLPEVQALKTPHGSEIALTLLRCTGWLSRDDFANRKGHAGPFLATPGAQMQGKWVFNYAVIPHTGGWQSAFDQAMAFNAPLRAVSRSRGNGGSNSLPASGSFLQVDPPAFTISAVKQAEDGRGWIVRGYNLGDETIQVSLQPWRAFLQVEQVRMDETFLGSLPVEADGSAHFFARGHEIISLRFTHEQPAAAN